MQNTTWSQAAVVCPPPKGGWFCLLSRLPGCPGSCSEGALWARISLVRAQLWGQR